MKVKKEKPNIKSNKGFTLIEVLLAIVILSLVSAPILRGFIVTANTSARARKIMEATDVAQLIVEEISAMTYEDGVKDTFLKDASTNRVPAVGYTAVGEVVSVAGIVPAQIPGVFSTAVGSAAADTKKCYRANNASWGDIVALPNLDYDGKKYDVLICFLPNSGEGTKYYTYNVVVEVYDQDSTTDEDGNVTYTHFNHLLVSLETEISNKY